MIKFIKETYSFEGKTLLVAAISAGWVPTFALDSLIVQNEFVRVAYFQSKCLYPSVGYLPKNIEGGALGLPAQVYLNGDVIILQFRSLTRFGRKRDLARQIASFIKNEKIGDVVILASLPYSIKPDREITSLQKNIYFKSKGKLGQKIMVQRCEELKLVHRFEQLKDQEEEQQLIMERAGLSQALLKQLQNGVVLMIFNESQEDKKTGEYFGKELFKLVDRKQISRG